MGWEIGTVLQVELIAKIAERDVRNVRTLRLYKSGQLCSHSYTLLITSVQARVPTPVSGRYPHLYT